MRTSPPGFRRLLDADVMIDIQHFHPPALTWLAAAPAGTLALPGFVVMELYQAASNRREQQATDLMIPGLPVVWPDERACAQAVIHFRQFHLSHNLGMTDVLIAATALTWSVPLCTFNLKHFRHIPNLVTEQPYVR